ncbi:hypothetical protein LTR37_016009 [Vermiconidia calcicola]|uniref:Uncharacterized protein n=1 Tax=Vermiconidia calcicola TaxID=1690605 RepID=A0ACC3MQB2_9PEZI|nr:hypothetical protein LTR37_016009 [Vermiconidia calcicola]
MARPFKGYDPTAQTRHSFEYRKEPQKAFKTQVAKFKQQLDDLDELRMVWDLEEASDTEDSPSESSDTDSESEEAEWKQTLTSAKFGRRILLRANQQINVREVKQLNSLYHAEGLYLNKVHDTIISSVFAEQDPGNKVQSFRGTYAQVTHATDLITTARGTTLKSWRQTPCRWLFNLEHEMLLEKFFKSCQLPNEGEKLMLSVVCDVDLLWVRKWFEEKQDQDQEFRFPASAAQDKAHKHEEAGSS